ncbi:MAG: LlaJI family restriction endonuclease [Lachnospira eligens]
MQQASLIDRCKVNTNWDEDIFVGLKCDGDDISIHFPLGFDISHDEKELRSDILLLLDTIRSTTSRKESEYVQGIKSYEQVSFPVQAYLEVIFDFYKRGYYKEIEVLYNVAKRGKINWNRTIKTQKAYIQDGNAYYLDFVTKNNSLQNDQMITLIHEYCVYESFDKIGWLFTNSMPQKPRIKFNYKMFKGILMDKIAATFNDNNKMLFRNLLAIIDYTGAGFSTRKFQYGTYRFEYVWESLVDKVYGISGKEEFFPKTYWNIDKNVVPNACLEPDTIMLCNNDVYVLDAKYYKYGATKRAVDLPESTSINKQITYGEYIDEQKSFRQKYGDNMMVYNAFLMPFNSKSDKWMTEDKVIRIGQAYGDWKTNLKSYEKVQGIVVDIKYLMKLSTRQNEEEIRVLADKIAKYVDEEV